MKEGKEDSNRSSETKTLDEVIAKGKFIGDEYLKQKLIKELPKTFKNLKFKKTITLTKLLDSPYSLISFYKYVLNLKDPNQEKKFSAKIKEILDPMPDNFFVVLNTIAEMKTTKTSERHEKEISQVKADIKQNENDIRQIIAVNEALDKKISKQSLYKTGAVLCIIAYILYKTFNIIYTPHTPPPQDFQLNVHKAAELGKLTDVQYHLEMLKVKKYLREKETDGTILHYACKGGNLELVKYLIENQKVPNEPIDFINGATPLHWACSTGSLPVVQYLLENKRATPDKTDGSKETAIFYACESGVLSIVKLLVENYNLSVTSKSSIGKQPIHVAAKSGSASVVEYLIGKGANIDSVDIQKWTPLHYACNFGKIDVVKYLVEHGAKMNMLDSIGRSPLRLAEYSNHPNIAEYLRSEGATY